MNRVYLMVHIYIYTLLSAHLIYSGVGAVINKTPNGNEPESNQTDDYIYCIECLDCTFPTRVSCTKKSAERTLNSLVKNKRIALSNDSELSENFMCLAYEDEHIRISGCYFKEAMGSEPINLTEPSIPILRECFRCEGDYCNARKAKKFSLSYLFPNRILFERPTRKEINTNNTTLNATELIMSVDKLERINCTLDSL